MCGGASRILHGIQPYFNVFPSSSSIYFCMFVLITVPKSQPSQESEISEIPDIRPIRYLTICAMYSRLTRFSRKMLTTF